MYYPSSISVVLTKACSEDELTTKPASNCTVVTGRARGGRSIFVLNLSFFPNTDLSFSMIGVYTVFTVQLNGSRRAEI